MPIWGSRAGWKGVWALARLRCSLTTAVSVGEAVEATANGRVGVGAGVKRVVLA